MGKVKGGKTSSRSTCGCPGNTKAMWILTGLRAEPRGRYLVTWAKFKRPRLCKFQQGHPKKRSRNQRSSRASLPRLPGAARQWRTASKFRSWAQESAAKLHRFASLINLHRVKRNCQAVLWDEYCLKWFPSDHSWGHPLIGYDQVYHWLVVWTPPKNISQLGWLFPIYWKMMKNEKCSKPPTRSERYCCFGTDVVLIFSQKLDKVHQFRWYPIRGIPHGHVTAGMSAVHFFCGWRRPHSHHTSVISSRMALGMGIFRGDIQQYMMIRYGTWKLCFFSPNISKSTAFSYFEYDFFRDKNCHFWGILHFKTDLYVQWFQVL